MGDAISLGHFEEKPRKRRAGYLASLLGVTVVGLIIDSTSSGAEEIVAAGHPGSVVKFGAFLDTYYAFDFNRPTGFDRTILNPISTPPSFYSTQPARHNEFNINLAFLEMTLEATKVRGRLALQAGTSVQSNYAAEPANGFVSGPDLSRHLQEANAGYRISNALWIDAGIYFSHIGLESFISRDNWTYTRSLSAENSPYYQTGVRLSYQTSGRFSAQLHLCNGWQTISARFPQKAAGTQLKYQISDSLVVVHNTFLGYEGGTRFLSDLGIQGRISERLELAATFDLGVQKPGGGLAENENWYGVTLLGRLRINERVALAGRLERFLDPSAVVVAPPGGAAFNVWGGSVGVDVELEPKVLKWRTEARRYEASEAFFPSREGAQRGDGFIVTSLSLTIQE